MNTLSTKQKFFRRFYRLFLCIIDSFLYSGYFWFLLGFILCLYCVVQILTTTFESPFFNNVSGMCDSLLRIGK